MVGSENITCSEDRTCYPEAPKCERVSPHLIVEGAIGAALRGGHSALPSNAHGHIRVNVDSHQLLGLQHRDPDLKGEEGGGKEANLPWFEGRTCVES